ncbi:NLI interacting factor-like phosphatase family protein, putative, partial [Ichthyophthirius multifiliis]
NKKTLVIDLDETLVHSSFTYINNADFSLLIKVQGMSFVVYVKKRPGCEIFLEVLSNYYEIIIYTASLSEYANPVIDIIDKKGVCSLRLFRENCSLYNGIFVKDMSKLQRDLKDIIIIDNSETSFLFQPANAIHILSYFDDVNDEELYRLLPVLIFLSDNYDVRHVGCMLKEFEQNEVIEYRNMKNQIQSFQNINEDIDLEKQLQEERQAELDQIQKEVFVMNNLMSDMGEMVVKQGEVIQVIAENADHKFII